MTSEVKSGTRTNLFIRLAVLVFICFCLITIIKTQIELNELQASKDDLEAQIDEYTGYVEELKGRLAQPFDDEYIMEVAREKLNYCLPDEIIFYNDVLK